MQFEVLFASNWTALFREKRKFVLLYDVHSLGNLIKKGERDWFEPFCASCGAILFQRFAFLEVHRLFNRANHLVILKIVELVIAKLPPIQLAELEERKLLDMILNVTDPKRIKSYLILFTEISKGINVMIRNGFFSPDCSVRSFVAKLMEKIPFIQQSGILLPAIANAFVADSGEFFTYL
jgi:hypothetical protein